jgi:hypothetical protein
MTWLKDNDPRHPARYLYVTEKVLIWLRCLGVQDAKAGHGSYEDDVRVRRTTVQAGRVHTDGKTRRSGYDVVPTAKVPRWAVKAVLRRNE